MTGNLGHENVKNSQAPAVALRSVPIASLEREATTHQVPGLREFCVEISTTF